MSIKSTVTKQYGAIIDSAASSPVQRLIQPKEGWIASVRKALGISAAQLGRIVGRTRANISASEKSEQGERATLKTMKTLAEAMGCRFVYAIVPAEGSIDDLIEKQARKLASTIVHHAGTHMALEKQSLSDKNTEEEIARLTRDIINDRPTDFWENR